MNVNKILTANLTQDQYNAVVDENRNVLCLACAGSGKSRTLAYKIAYLISQGVAPESIVAFTFTEKAADSIKRRVAEALHKFDYPENYIGAMFIGTIDSFCQKLLGNIDATFRQYDILDQNGLILFVMSRYGKLGIPQGSGYFKRIKEITDAWQTANNENISFEDIKTLDPQLGNILLKIKRAFLHDGYMDFSYAIRLATEELKKIEKKKEQILKNIGSCLLTNTKILTRFRKSLSKHSLLLWICCLWSAMTIRQFTGGAVRMSKTY